jgi:predicted ArsR family transcriptional regulator
MMRALAHPARIAIMQHLAVEGPATATQCAEVTGLSPSACSYHLRTLSRYGFVEVDPGSTTDGRQRPWRAAIIAVNVSDDARQPAPVRAAARLLTDSMYARIAQIRAQYQERAAQYSPQWQGAAGSMEDIVHLTAAELQQLRDEMRELLGRYRRLDREQRPPGAGRVHALVEFLPSFDPAGPQ